MPPLIASPSPPRWEPPAEPACPCCGGRVVPLRGQVRCSRCAFVLCEECEGMTNDECLNDERMTKLE